MNEHIKNHVIYTRWNTIQLFFYNTALRKNEIMNWNSMARTRRLEDIMLTETVRNKGTDIDWYQSCLVPKDKQVSTKNQQQYIKVISMQLS